MKNWWLTSVTCVTKKIFWKEQIKNSYYKSTFKIKPDRCERELLITLNITAWQYLEKWSLYEKTFNKFTSQTDYW